MIFFLNGWRRQPKAPIGAHSRLRPAANVLRALGDERCVLLDLRAGRYLGLDEVGSRIWAGIERGATRADIVTQLAEEYDAAADVLDTDAQHFIGRLQQFGLVVDQEASAPQPPTTAACLAAIALVDAATNLLGIGRMHALARCTQAVTFVDPTVAPDAPIVTETVRRVVLAAAFYPRRAICLEQALALLLLLRRRGVPAEFSIGAKTLPFSPHAWITVAGEPIFETENLPQRMALFAAPEV